MKMGWGGSGEAGLTPLQTMVTYDIKAISLIILIYILNHFKDQIWQKSWLDFCFQEPWTRI